MSTQTISTRIDTFQQSAAQRSPTLTEKEIQILQLAADGEDSKSAAAVLHISVNTLKNARHLILLKLGADNLAHAVAQALRRRIIS